MSDKIKLSELRAVRDKIDLAIERAMRRGPDVLEFAEIADEVGPDDVAGIVATHNAADALIELAEAFVARRAAGMAAARARARWGAALGPAVGRGRTLRYPCKTAEEPALYAEMEPANQAEIHAKARLDAALARFAP